MANIYLVVEIKDGKVVWSDTSITTEKSSAKTRLDCFTKFGRGRVFEVWKVKQFQKVDC